MNEDQKQTLAWLNSNALPQSELIVERGNLPEQLKAEILPSDSVKLLVAGQRGMGKTTELRRFVTLLADSKFLPIFLPFGAQESITHAGLIYAMANALYSDPNSKLEEKSFQSFQDWYAQEEVVQLSEEGTEGTAGVGGSVYLLEARGKIHKKSGKRSTKTRRAIRDIRQLLDRFNSLVRATHDVTKKRVVFIVDDIDKVQDESSIESTFIHSSHLVANIEAPCIFTVPITYATSSSLKIATLPYNNIYRVPAVEVIDDRGRRIDASFKFMRDVFLRRMRFNPLNPELMDRVIQYSGGVLIDAMRMLRDICMHAILESQSEVSPEVVELYFQKLVDDFKFVFDRPALWKKLPLICKSADKAIIMTDDCLPELLYKMIVIEYRTNKHRFDLHPAARRLYEQNCVLIDGI